MDKPLTIICDFCNKPLEELGGLIFSPPYGNGDCKKNHICKNCYKLIWDKNSLDILREEEIKEIINNKITDIAAGIASDGLVNELTKALAGKVYTQPDPTDGELLYRDLCGRLIKRILEFNPDEHDIELNLCGIIEKAKRTHGV